MVVYEEWSCFISLLRKLNRILKLLKTSNKILCWDLSILPYSFCHNFLLSFTLTYFYPKLKKSTNYVYYRNSWRYVRIQVLRHIGAACNTKRHWHVSTEDTLPLKSRSLVNSWIGSYKRMNFIDELLLKIVKEIYCGAITTLLLSTSLIPNLWSWTLP